MEFKKFRTQKNTVKLNLIVFMASNRKIGYFKSKSGYLWV